LTCFVLLSLYQGYLRKLYGSGDDMLLVARAFTKKEQEAVSEVAKSFRKVDTKFLAETQCLNLYIHFLGISWISFVSRLVICIELLAPITCIYCHRQSSLLYTNLHGPFPVLLFHVQCSFRITLKQVLHANGHTPVMFFDTHRTLFV
jgi:hypothetical protein